MPNIFTPSQDQQVFFPFGPAMGYKKLSDEFVNGMNAEFERSGQLNDYSQTLVGKVKEELEFNDSMKQLLFKEIKTFVFNYNSIAIRRNSFSMETLDAVNTKFAFEFASGWIVRQFEHEYNPIHFHTGSKMSCVGYLKLPDGIEAEWEQDYEDHHPSHGHIQFVHGTVSSYSSTNFTVKPCVGDFYLFPSDLFHCVYPFFTKGERRSFSANFSLKKIT